MEQLFLLKFHIIKLVPKLKMKYKHLIADDHTLFNKGVKQLFSDNYDIVT